MSGGSLDYSFERLEDLARLIEARSKDPLHLAFARHIAKCAKAAHDVEWVLSGDYGDGDEVESIRAVVSPQSQLESAVQDANAALDALHVALARAQK